MSETYNEPEHNPDKPELYYPASWLVEPEVSGSASGHSWTGGPRRNSAQFVREYARYIGHQPAKTWEVAYTSPVIFWSRPVKIWVCSFLHTNFITGKENIRWESRPSLFSPDGALHQCGIFETREKAIAYWSDRYPPPNVTPTFNFSPVD